MAMEPHSLSIDIAISHNREDSELAVSLLVEAESSGLIGWIDRRAFYSPLIAAERQIERAFRKARFIYLLVGNSYRDSPWCQEEYKYGLRSEADLAITRILVILQSSAAAALVPPLLKGAPCFNLAIKEDKEKICNLRDGDLNNSSRIAKWSRCQQTDEASLVSRLPKSERLKLVGDHLEFLVLNFEKGMIDVSNHQSALRLEVTAGPPSAVVSHFSPALAMEMCWRSVREILGEHDLNEFVERNYIAEDVRHLYICDLKMLFERVLPVYLDYLRIAAARRQDDQNILKFELFAILDYVICGFLAVIFKAQQCDDNLVDGVRKLLRFVVKYGAKPIADAAEYLDAGLPAIGLPEFSISRKIHVRRLINP